MAEHTSPKAPDSPQSPFDRGQTGNSPVGGPAPSPSDRDRRQQAESGASRWTNLSVIDRIFLFLDHRAAKSEKCERDKKR